MCFSLFKMILLLFLISACFASFTDRQKLHELMTKEEIELVFKVNHDAVHKLEYELVPVFHKNEEVLQSANPTIHLRAFNKNYTLYLEKNENVFLGTNTSVFLAKASSTRRYSDEPRIVYSKMAYPLPENFKLYHDLKNRAAVTLHTDDDNKVHVHGTVGDDVIIRSLPPRVHKEVLNERSSFFNSLSNFDFPFIDNNDDDVDDDDDFYQITHHVVIKPTQQGYSPFPSSIDDQWNQITQQFLNPSKKPVNSFQSWGSIFNRPNQEPVNLYPTYNKPTTKYPTTTKKPITWRPFHFTSTTTTTTRKPFTWRPVSKEPSTQKPHISHPTTSVPVTEKPTTASTATPKERSGNTVYPELLVVVDYETYTFHGSDVNEVAKYMAAFWNAVDLRFRELDNPKIRLNIAGLIIPKQSDGTAYMDRFRVGTKTVLADKTLESIGEYFSKEKNFPKDKYDIVVGISHRNLGDIASGGKLQDGITGIATFEGVCLTEQGQSVALVRDKGGFNGITTAAHELAHTLGAPHDGDESETVPGGPCSWADGYLMSYERKDSKGMHWSKCSQTALHLFLTSKQAQCLKNKPNVGTPYPKILPGKLLSRDEQCKRSMGLVSYKEKENDCAVLYCAKYMRTQVSINSESRPPAEGSYCGEGKICLDAQCVDDPEL